MKKAKSTRITEEDERLILENKKRLAEVRQCLPGNLGQKFDALDRLSVPMGIPQSMLDLFFKNKKVNENA